MDVLHDPGATEILMDIEVSVDLKTWQSAGISLEKTSEVMADEGRVWLRYLASNADPSQSSFSG